MEKSKKLGITIRDFFGLSRKYAVFSVESELSLYPFASQLKEKSGCNFSYLDSFEPNFPQYSPRYEMMYSCISEVDNLNVVILENKTVFFNESKKLYSQKEKNLRFQTLSLFDDYLYIFNSHGKYLFKSEFPDYDYLILVYVDKESDYSCFTKKLDRYRSLRKVYDSMLHTEDSDILQRKKIDFLCELFCKIEMNIMKSQKRYYNEILLGEKQIPAQNLNNSAQYQECRIINPKYVTLLEKDTTFE